MLAITETEKAYIAGFLDGDGCIMFQLVRRKDYKLGFQVRASIVFYQKTSKKSFMSWLKSIFEVGYIRDRKDGMTEYTIVGLNPVKCALELLEPYLMLKKDHAILAKRIFSLLWQKKPDSKELVEIAKLVDKFKQLNYSKKRIITAKVVKDYLRNINCTPVTTDPIV